MQVQKPALVQKQELRLSPQLLQSIQILALPLIDLKARIEEEIETNPALEITEEKDSLSIEDLPARRSEEMEYFDNSSDSGFSFDGYDDEAGDNKRRFMEGALSRPESLQDHLIWQLRLHPLPEEYFQIGELLIRNLNENGFHREDPDLLISEDRRAATHAVIDIIRGFEPPGTCTKDYKEALRVQALQFAYIPPGSVEIIDCHLEALDKGKYKEIAKALKITEEEVVDALHFIQQLSPFPGRLYSNEQPQYVIPDVQVTRREDEFVIILNDEEIPVLGINPFFDRLSLRDRKAKSSKDNQAATVEKSESSEKNGAGTKTELAAKKEEAEVQQFVQNKLRDAKWFINSLRMRNDTLLKVAQALVEFQKDFFLKGPRAIVPLTLKDIASEIGVHETTVSRLTNGKYMQTDWGLYEMKYFFSSAVSGTSGERFSKEGVKQIVKDIIEEEHLHSLSDQKISELLEKRGIRIARRTVAKYRKELDIDSSYSR